MHVGPYQARKQSKKFSSYIQVLVSSFSGKKHQSIGFFLVVFRYSFVLEKCLHPKKPRLADKGDGWGPASTKCRFCKIKTHTYRQRKSRHTFDKYNSFQGRIKLWFHKVIVSIIHLKLANIMNKLGGKSGE